MTGEHPRLRPELRFIYRDEGADEAVIIEDPLGGSFVETDPETAAFARLLDGERSGADAFARLASDYPASRLTQGDLVPLLDELRRHGLLVGSESEAPRGAGGRIGIVSQRIRLGTWDAFFAFCAGHLKWLYSPFGALLWLALLIAGIAELAGNWSAFRHDIGSLFSVDLILLLWFAWVVAKLWHECQHGIVARLYGVEIREVGILFILFLPLGAYVDATGAWRLKGRWRRLHITAAGIMGELALGAAAMLLWSQAEAGQWKAFLQSLVVATTISTVVFNANPLMRYDGYYALVDLLRISNLYQRGAAAVRDRALRALTGIRPKLVEGGLIELYGWFALAWRLVAATTLTVMATHLAFGFGLALSAVIVWTMLLAPFGGFLRNVWKLGAGHHREIVLRAGVLAVAMAALWFAPLPIWLSAPGVISYRDALEVRAATSGTVVELLVRSGDSVRQGEPLLVLANPSLAAEHRRLLARKSGTEILLARARSEGNPTAQEGAEQALAAMGEEIADTEMRLAGLAVNAQQPGVVYGKDLDALAGRWVERGQLIGRIAEPERLEVKAWLLPDDAQMLRQYHGSLFFQPAVHGLGRVQVALVRVDPVASNALPPAAITAEGGGSLAIDVSASEHRLVDVRFGSRFAPPDTPPGWISGTPGRLQSGLRWRSIGSFAVEWLDNVNLGRLPRWAHLKS